MFKQVLRLLGLLWFFLIAFLFAVRALGQTNPAPILSYISSTRFNNADIMLADVRSGILLNMTNSPYISDNLQWSIDGHYLLYRSARDYSSTYFVLDTENWQLRQLAAFERDTMLFNIGTDSVVFIESYGGETITLSLATGEEITASEDTAFACNPPNCYFSSGEYYLLKPSLVDDAVYVELEAVAWEELSFLTFEYMPLWSADGESFLFRTNLQGQSDIYLGTAEGGFARRLTNSREAEDMLAWSNDSHWLTYTQYVNGRSDVFVLELATGEIMNISHNPRPDIKPAWQP